MQHEKLNQNVETQLKIVSRDDKYLDQERM